MQFLLLWRSVDLPACVQAGLFCGPECQCDGRHGKPANWKECLNCAHDVYDANGRKIFVELTCTHGLLSKHEEEALEKMDAVTQLTANGTVSHEVAESFVALNPKDKRRLLDFAAP